MVLSLLFYIVNSYVAEHTFSRGSGYIGLLATRDSYNSSQMACQMVGGDSDLVSFATKAEATFVMNAYISMTEELFPIVPHPTHFWIGGSLIVTNHPLTRAADMYNFIGPEMVILLDNLYTFPARYEGYRWGIPVGGPVRDHLRQKHGGWYTNRW